MCVCVCACVSDQRTELCETHITGPAGILTGDTLHTYSLCSTHTPVLLHLLTCSHVALQLFDVACRNTERDRQTDRHTDKQTYSVTVTLCVCVCVHVCVL